MYFKQITVEGMGCLSYLIGCPQAEWDVGHIRNARHYPLTELLKGSVGLPKDREVIAACGVGYRGNIAASFLQQQGFEHVHSLAGGMKAWINGGYPVVTD